MRAPTLLGYTLLVKPLAAIVCLLAVLAVTPTFALERGVADVEIDATLDAARHEIAGSERIRWRNTTSVATSELWFHLYLNAFASSASTFMRELDRDPMGSWGVRDGQWGWIRITRLELRDGTDLMGAVSFERPDDGNPQDFTVARVELPAPVLPGESVELEVGFSERLPRVVARTGFAGDFHMVGQWYPKLGVFEGENGWNCHQFHAASEFFADFGDYRVSLTVPRDWVVGATGELVSREPVGTDDRLSFEARDVHDFAWTAAPPELMTTVTADFDPGRDVPQVWFERAMSALEIGPAELELPPMTIRLIVPQSQTELAPRMVRAVRLAIAWFGLTFGPYPEPGLTVVSPPPGAGAAGGMEYPTLITTGASRLDTVPPFSWRDEIESVTVHEFGHQIFQGLVATNEFEAAWLDEGLTTWAEHRCLDDVAADRLAPEIRFSQTSTRSRLLATFAELPVTIDRPTWRQRVLADTYVASYHKTAVALRTLEGVLGEDRMLRAVRSYVNRARYRHPTGRDFQSSLEEATGEDLEWFFDGVIRGDRTPDWAVLSVRQDAIEPVEGMVWRDGGWHEAEKGPTSDDGGATTWRVIVDIGRRGDLRAPVEVELVWADGRSERRRWDGRDRWVSWRMKSTERLRRVIVDPDGVWALEARRADNYWCDAGAGLGRMWWLNDALLVVALLSVPWS